MKKNYKITKLERNRFSIITDNIDYCIICGRTKQELHEVIFGKNRLNSMKYGLVIPLCAEHHREIHKNSELDRYYKKLAQIKFEETYDDDFLSIFYKNYKD